jgi:LysR family transcriptional regulator, transcription activator of glutamate synthase operon
MRISRINIDDLRVFLTVADTEHVTAAAGRLHLSQPAITRALLRLEQQLGVQLFDRPGHRVRLNAYGRSLVTYAGRIVGQLDAAESELAALSDPHAGPVRVGFLPSLGTWLVPDLIRSFRAIEPGVRFVIHQATADHLSQMLGNGEIDMVLTSPRPKLDEPAGWKPLANEQLGLAVPPDHRLATRRRVNLSEASDDPFIAFTPEAGLRQIADRLCRHAGFAPTVAFQSSDVATVRALVRAGFGVAILPSDNPPDRDTSPPMLTITDRGARRQLGLAWLTRRRLPAMAEAFRRWLTEIDTWGSPHRPDRERG